MLRGAGRGLGTDIAKAALAAGHAVVATGRDAAKVAAAVGTHSDLLTIKLDVTRPPDAQDRNRPRGPAPWVNHSCSALLNQLKVSGPCTRSNSPSRSSRQRPSVTGQCRALGLRWGGKHHHPGIRHYEYLVGLQRSPFRRHAIARINRADPG